MRPRVFPAEDASAVGRGRRLLPPRDPNGASMRPRVFPAEDIKEASNFGFKLWAASMRPRVFPAEDLLVVKDQLTATVALQ